MLLQAILAVFGLFAIAALVIDLGFARLTQVQMQSAADAAALEGLRGRDSLGDEARRAAASALVTRIFTDPSGERLVGAGPDIALSGGTGEWKAGQTIEVGADPVYRPQLALNLANAAHGDMVSGTFDGTVIVPAADAAASALGPAFQVQLRRTDGSNHLDNSNGIEVASGAAVTLLFGRGSLVQKRDGFTVRATAVADGRPARRVGTALVAPFTLSRTFWESSLPDGFPVTLNADASGALTLGVLPAGTYAQPPLTLIGRPVMAAPPSPILDGPRYVPIHDTVNGVPRVIGYGYIELSATAGTVLVVTRTSNRLAAGNASLHIAEGFADIPDLALLLAANSSLSGALLVPAVVR